MMQAFRNSAKPVVYLITITFMIWLVVDLSGLSGSGGVLSQTSVGRINGQSVDTRIYQQAVQNAITQRQQQIGSSLGLMETEQVRDEVWESFIQSAVLQDEINKRRLAVTGEEIAGLLRAVPPPQLQGDPSFQTNGQFDINKYRTWLTSPVGQQFVPLFEAQYREEILRAKLLRNVTADIFLSDAALWERYRDQNELVSIALTPLVPNRVVSDSGIDVSADEIDAYYRANPDEFERPSTAFLSYIAVSRVLDPSDSAAALTRAESLRDEVLGGAEFADVALRESSDLGSAQVGGELGTFGRGAMVEEFEDAAYSLPLNTVSDPVLSQFGYHLIEVTDRSGDSVTARHILVPMEIAGVHRDLVDAQADSLELLGADRLDPAALDTAARVLRLPIGQAAPLQDGSAAVVGPTMLQDPGIWAFQAKVGETSPVIETEESYYVFRLDSLYDAGVPPLELIRGVVTNAVIISKKEARAIEMANELIRRINAGEPMADASTAMGLEHREFPEFARIQPPLPNPKLIGGAFGLPVNALSKPIVTTEGVYVIRVLSRTAADSAEFLARFDEIQAMEVRAARDERVRFYLAALREGADIVDNRSAIFLTQAQLDAQAPDLPLNQMPTGF